MVLKKAQSAIELVLIISAVLFFFSAVIIAMQANMQTKTSQAVNKNLEEQSLLLRDEIALASSSTEGYSRNFTLSEKILNNVDYNISINAGMIYAITLNEKNSFAIMAKNVTGQPKKGINQIRKKTQGVFLN